MTPHDLLAAFETLAEAPDGIARLRELVLQLAVRGMLVPQDPGDEPACMLLKHIDAEKARLVKEGKIPKLKLLPTVDEDEVPFVMPKGWVWVRLGTIALNIHYGYTASANHQKRGVLLLRITDIQNNTVNWLSVPGCNIDQDQVERYRLNDGDIVVARTGGTVGKTYQVSGLIGLGAVFASYLIRVKNPAAIDSTYLKYSMETPLYWSQLLSMAAGTGQPNVNATSLSELLLPLPPLPEQYRIVAKVDILMALLDNMEAARSEREIIRAALRDAALAALRDAPDVEAVESTWTRIAERMDDLFTDPADVAPLRQTILQLAVRGKLVPQDPNDEPACMLLERIAAEKVQLMKEGKISKPKLLPPVGENEVPFGVPRAWVWCRFDSVLVDIQAGWSPSSQSRPKEGSEWGVLKVSACSWGEFLPDENKALLPDTYPRPELEVREGDFLISRANTLELVARSVVVRRCPPRLMLSDKTLRLVTSSFAHVDYLNLANISDGTRQFYATQATGTSSSMRNVSQEAIRSAPIPLPPLPEQHRIVAKVDALMALCDALETQLIGARAAQAAFAAAAVHHPRRLTDHSLRSPGMECKGVCDGNIFTH